MRDRLVELLYRAHHNASCVLYEGGSEEEILEEEARYLLKYGVIVPPCKVGDTVYQPSYKFTKCSAHDYAPRCIEASSCCDCGAKCDFVKEPYIYEGTVVSIRVTKEQNFLAVSFQEKFDSSSFILGKTVFLTREEAERAVKGEHDGQT